jgi:hypothetical protein
MLSSLSIDTRWFYVHSLSLEYGGAAYMLSRKQGASKKCVGVFFSIGELFENVKKLGATEEQMEELSLKFPLEVDV